MHFSQFYFLYAFLVSKMEGNIYNFLSLPYWNHNLTKGTMIVDNLANAANYYNLHPLFEKAFEFIGNWAINNVETGTVEIDGNLLKATLVPGEFIIFSPEDGHAPLIGEGEIKKIIIKVVVI